MTQRMLSLALLAPLCFAPPSPAAFDTYGRSFRVVHAPAPSDGSFTTLGGALADGRLVAATGYGVYIETGVGSGQFTLGASIDAALFPAAPDPAFMAVSSNGSRIALGGGLDFSTGLTKPVLVFDAASLTGQGATLTTANTRSFLVDHSGGAWLDNDRLALSAGGFGSATRVDLLDATGGAGVRTIVDNIQGASAGVAFDADGRMYVGNGFATGAGDSATGWIKAFDSSLFLTGGTADYEADGVFIGRALSASPLAFDASGNLGVGGGDFFGGDSGYAALMSADAVAAALAGAGGVDRDDPASFRALDPAGSGSAFYAVFFNHATGEMVLTDGSTWYVTVPAPWGVGVFALAALAGRRRRDGV